MSSISVLIASCGRSSLHATVDSIVGQLMPGDELIVDVNNDAPWGHAARNRMMPRARGEALMFLDDDDLSVPGALDHARRAIDEDPFVPHIFRMAYENGAMLWLDEHLRCGNVSTQMLVVPNQPEGLGEWGDRYEGDYDFIDDTCRRMGSPKFHPELIALYNAVRA